MKIPLLLAGLLLLQVAATAQADIYAPGYNTTVYVMDAAQQLPLLYKQGMYDSIKNYLTKNAHYTGDQPYIFASTLLVNIQENTFTDSLVTGRYFLYVLDDYANNLKIIFDEQGNVIKYNSYSNSHAESQVTLFTFNKYWAKNLLQTKQLTATQQLLCNVIAGAVQQPMVEIKTKHEKYPVFDSLLRARDVERRNSFAGNTALNLGAWLPQGHAALLGVHPSVGVSVGMRNKLNQVDLTVNARFVRAAHHYNILRRDTLYSRDAYSGVYAGLNYTHYLAHTRLFEAGYTVGFGYDALSITTQGSDEHYDDYLKPLGLTSANINAGFRANYFIKPRHYIGLEGKYNYMHYNNKGGTPLGGYAYTLALIAGFN